MGFTPMEGLMMGTRSGSVDPGLLLHLLREQNLTVEELDHALNFQSGLLGVSGVSADMREVLAAAASNPDAKLALDVYVHRLQQAIGGMAAVLGGLDALVFTAGVGENAPQVRQMTCANLQHLGVRLDEAANAARIANDRDIGAADSNVRVLVIHTREDLTIVRDIRRLLAASSPAGAQSRSLHSTSASAEQSAMKEYT